MENLEETASDAPARVNLPGRREADPILRELDDANNEPYAGFRMTGMVVYNGGTSIRYWM